MRAAILLLTFLAIAARATAAVPHFKAFFLDPSEAAGITITDKGPLEHIDVVLSKQQAEWFKAYARTNADQPYVIAYIQRQKNMSTQTIQMIWLNPKAYQANGVLHLQLPNPHRNPQIIDPILLSNSAPA